MHNSPHPNSIVKDRMGSRDYLHSGDMASEIIIAFPAHPHLHAYEIRGYLLDLPHLDLG